MKHLTMNELHEMTMKAMQAWINECACEINRTAVMAWDHKDLFKELHVVPEILGYNAGRFIVEGFHFTGKARKADMVEFVQWLHWAISGEYPTEETENTEEENENTETIEEEATTMKKFFKVSFEYSKGIYCTNLAHAESVEDVERHYSEYAWRSVKEAQPWDVDEARMKGMPIIEIEHEEPAQDAAEAPETAQETETEEQTTEAQETATEAAEAASEAHTTEEKKEEEHTMKTTSAAITTPAFIRSAILDIIARMNAQIGAVNPKTGKPILNGKTVKKLAIVSEVLDRITAGKKVPTVDQIRMLQCIHVSENMTAKLEDVNACSTACSANPICQARAKDCKSICAHCFAFLTFERYNDLEQAAVINFIVLNAMVYSTTAWKAIAIPASAAGQLFRIEAFGDTASAVQAANYISMVKTHRYLGKVGVWSKNLGFWATAFNALGKPSSIVFNASSPVMNTPIEIKPEFLWFVDHVFTVYTADYAINNGININCGDRKCKNCRRCYKHNNEKEVAEIVKQESKKYYKAIGKAFTGRQ